MVSPQGTNALGERLGAWKTRVGIKKSHFYPHELCESPLEHGAKCGVAYHPRHLIPESSTQHRCTVCKRYYESKMGLFA